MAAAAAAAAAPVAPAAYNHNTSPWRWRPPPIAPVVAFQPEQANPVRPSILDLGLNPVAPDLIPYDYDEATNNKIYTYIKNLNYKRIKRSLKC